MSFPPEYILAYLVFFCFFAWWSFPPNDVILLYSSFLSQEKCYFYPRIFYSLVLRDILVFPTSQVFLPRENYFLPSLLGRRRCGLLYPKPLWFLSEENIALIYFARKSIGLLKRKPLKVQVKVEVSKMCSLIEHLAIFIDLL